MFAIDLHALITDAGFEENLKHSFHGCFKGSVAHLQGL